MSRIRRTKPGVRLFADPVFYYLSEPIADEPTSASGAIRGMRGVGDKAGGKRVTIDASDPSAARASPEHDAKQLESLREQAMQRLRAGEWAQAIDLLSRAAAMNPDEPWTQLNLGVALQGTRRHAEALEAFERAQKSLPQDPMPFLHASLSLLALRKAEAALQAAREACARAPQLPQAHSAYGQALMALNEPERAEQAFAIALRHAPQWADVWVLCGVARHRQGAIEGAKAAMREALRHAPDHAVAKDNLAALLRIGGEEQAASSAAPEARAPPAVEPPEAKDDLKLSAWRPKSPSASLGLAVEYLSKKPAFAKLQFGEWSQVLYYQVVRGHFFFVVDPGPKGFGISRLGADLPASRRAMGRRPRRAATTNNAATATASSSTPSPPKRSSPIASSSTRCASSLQASARYISSGTIATGGRARCASR